MILHDGFGHETSHSCPHGKQPGEYCEPCNSLAIASGIPLNPPASAKDKVCAAIQQIMASYREQEAAGEVDTPGGLEHMGDVWRLLASWDRELSADKGNPR